MQQLQVRSVSFVLQNASAVFDADTNSAVHKHLTILQHVQ